MKSERRTVLRPAFALAAVIIATSFQKNVADAQLLGCDAVGCPQNQQNPLQSSCVLGGIVNNEIGIANFTSAISPEPLTWTIGVSGIPDSTNSTEQIWSRNFYLGTPSALNMTDVNTITGCALFFEGISSSLRFPSSNIDTSIGTCNDALSAACVTDLMSQANSSLLQLTKNMENVCGGLEVALRNSAPKSCNVTQHGAWGGITAKAITGSSTSYPIPIGDCNPTTGTNYSVSYIENYNITSEPISTILDPFIGGITPIMTLFFPTLTDADSGNTKDQSMGPFNTPEVHLSCLKVVERQTRSQPVQGTSSRFVQPSLKMAQTLLFSYGLAGMMF